MTNSNQEVQDKLDKLDRLQLIIDALNYMFEQEPILQRSLPSIYKDVKREAS